MNMNQNPTKDQLRKLVESCDDNAGHHLIWVGNDGSVNITCLTQESELPEKIVRFRYEILVRGNGYVGPQKGKAGEMWLGQTWEDLTRDWSEGNEGFIDY